MPYTSKKVSLPEGFVDLGEKMKPMTAIDIESESEPVSIHYPSLYFSNAKELMDFPNEGTAVIHFKKVMERKETVIRNGEEKKCYCVELEIHGIKSNGKSKMESMEEEEDDEDAIEKGLKEAEGEEKDEEYED